MHTDANIPHRFELALYLIPSTQTVGLGEYVKTLRQGGEKGRPALEFMGMHLTVNGHEYLSPRWTMGPLNRLVPQLLPLHRRLAAGLPALLRAGATDSDTGTYLLMEPEEQTVYISMLFLHDITYSHSFPIPEESSHAQTLYTHILNQRDALLTQSSMQPRAFQRVPYPLPALLQAIEEQQQLVGEFAKLYGPY